ncbi:hypothetical protein Q7P37_010559 [Cladosporium fusiforme]
MTSQQSNSPGGGKKESENMGTRGTNPNPTNITTTRSNPPSSKGRGQSSISFVAFDAGISKESRKAVRVQAAKASAATRKATIARKLAEQKKVDEVTHAVQAPAKKAPKAQKQSEGGKVTSVQPVIQKPSLAPLTLVEYQPVQQPSVASSNSSRVFSEADTDDYFRASRPSTPSGTLQSTDPCTLHFSNKACRCRRCKQITPPSSLESSPRMGVDNYELDDREKLETFRAIARHAVPRPDRISPGRHDPFSCYPVQWQPWYDGLLHYMMTVFAPRAWPILKITATQGARWEWFMTQHAMEEPALFYVRLLFASGDLIRIGALKRECSYWLQSQAINAINEALRDPRRSVCDGLILAVGRIALHECMYGDRKAANTVHRPAQRRMIDMRGGMGGLDFPELVKRLMRWGDRVMSMQGNTSRFLPDDEDEGNSSFGVKQSVDVFEAWAPEPGQALRKKIAISDLLTDD